MWRYFVFVENLIRTTRYKSELTAYSESDDFPGLNKAFVNALLGELEISCVVDTCVTYIIGRGIQSTRLF